MINRFQPFVFFSGLYVLLLAAISMAAPQALSGASDKAFALVADGNAVDIYVAEGDWKVAHIAATDLSEDVERVAGIKPVLRHDVSKLGAQAVIIGTLGKSAVIDQMVKDGKLEVSDVEGQWETFVMNTIQDPLPGVERAIVIAGSDRRGTAYGAYELSRRIGVSPWYWWADVIPETRDELVISSERIKVGPPEVKYRGIFINDEMWGLRP